MSERTHAGEARTGLDEPHTEKRDVYVLGNGETHIPEDDAVLLTDGNGISTPRFCDLSALQRDLILLLAWSQPTTGADLRTDLTAQHDKDVAKPTLYKNLDELDGLGLVDKEYRASDDRSNSYSLTETGRRTVRQFAQLAVGAVDVLDQEAH